MSRTVRLRIVLSDHRLLCLVVGAVRLGQLQRRFSIPFG